ncbi:hypothetical protein STAFG_5622 [Streptomyces afghaniensis 772]|uniref:Uncharacterized protein n=1 Tax=Streptomyces afghaniensis 772 TaxID=1283301 RepID=S4ML20_9ACTN|nr:hypothetical protein STAFG_5622 [Streptomyces afghaniensis 772]
MGFAGAVAAGGAVGGAAVCVLPEAEGAPMPDA